MAKIYNIPASCSLIDVLAKKLLAENKNDLLQLSKIKIFLPNQRAVRELQNAFVRLHGMDATLLPQITSLSNFDEGIFFNSDNYLNIPKPISTQERLLLFIRLITARPDNFRIDSLTFAQACYLAKELASLVDMTNNENLDFASLEHLVPEEYAAHWQNTLHFLKIITEFYPQILKEKNLIDLSEYNRLLINEQIAFWQKNPPQNQIIIAGSTATFPAMKEMTKAVLALPNGSVWLSGIDKYLDDSSWQKIDEQHPQYELKELLDFLNISRFDVIDIASPEQDDREKFISEVMRPATSTDKWQNLSSQKISSEALHNFHMINCRDSKEEALVIASIMRHNLETPEKTTALITTDRNLARRVSNELLRWNIKADDSAGIPVLQTPQGIFLRLIAALCQDNFSPFYFLSLYKHPLCSVGQNSADIRKQIREFEKDFLRKRESKLINNPPFIEQQKQIFTPLIKLLSQKKADFKQLLIKHLEIAEILASTKDSSGAEILWYGNNGETLAKFFAELLDAADIIGEIPQGQYLDFFEALLSGTMVREKYGAHPRLRILGAIEARLCSFDCVIISSLNEGTMPETSSSNAWLSRPMQKDFGLPLPEKSIGVLAHDFYEMVCGKEIYLTRAEKVQSTPTIKSRWWLRIETVADALGFDMQKITDSPYLKWAQKLDKSETISPISSPSPQPPLAARPRELWASDIEKLLYDPYSVFASKILKLRKLNDINLAPDAVDLGIIIHSLLENFYTSYPKNFPDNAADILHNMAQKIFEENNIPCETMAFWQPKIDKIINWIISAEQDYRFDITETFCEKSGTINFSSAAGDFTIGAKADRIDVTKDGTLNIIDYKTGSHHTAKEIKAGYAPQLPIEGIIAEQGGFKDIPAKTVSNISYWHLGEEIVSIEKDIENILYDNFEKIKKLINHFDNPDSAYFSRPNPKYSLSHSDYTHLSRINEWEINSNDEE